MASSQHLRFRSQTLLAVFIAGCTSLFAADRPSFQGNGEPLHPSAITTTHQGDIVPVVSVVDQRAQIQVGEKTMEAPANSAYTFVRLPAFAPGRIDIRSQEALQLKDEVRDSEGMVIQDLANNIPTVEYRATLVPDSSYAAAFLVVVVFDKEFLAGAAAPNTAVFFSDLGALDAGQAREVKLNLGKFTEEARARMQYFPLIYTGGREVRTQLAELSAAYFRRMELARHSAIVKNYLTQHAEADRALQPYVRVAPIIPSGSAGSVPTKVNARLSIGDDGIVKQVDVQTEMPAAVKTELERALGGWLFLPKLAKGKPVETKAVVPLQINL